MFSPPASKLRSRSCSPCARHAHPRARRRGGPAPGRAGDERRRRLAGGAASAPSGLFAGALCAVDGTDQSIAAIRHAGSLVGPGGHLTLLLCTAYRQEWQLRSPAIGPLEASEIVSQAEAAAAAAGVSASVEVDPEGSPGELIVRRAAEHGLLALGAPATMTWLGAMFRDSVTAIAEESLAVPVLVSRLTPSWSGRSPRSVLVASDGLDSSDGLVQLAGLLAREQGAETALVHALGSESRMHPHRIRRQAKELGSVTGTPSELVVESGAPREVIVAAARELDAGLIVMSSRRLAGLRTVGSVSRPVVAHAHCSVLLVPPEMLAAAQPA